ncbi:MAG: ECF transporter S component [Patescibacteria group bacterium]
MENTRILNVSLIRAWFYSLVFVALSVALPLVFHLIPGGQAGKIFLPMHIFIFAAGLVLGWKQGIFAGIITPLISYTLSGMPSFAVLPFIIIELAAYGALSGYFRNNLKLNILLSLLGAMTAGRAILWLAIIALPSEVNAGQYIFMALKTGLPGILAQILLAPAIVFLFGKYLNNERI